MFIILIIPIFALDSIKQQRSIICGCSVLTYSECYQADWCSLQEEFDKCQPNNQCITYTNENECYKNTEELCIWTNNQCISRCKLLATGTCQDKEFDSDCSQFTDSNSCSTYSWCTFNTTSNTCNQLQQLSCSSYQNQTMCESVKCNWDDIDGCINDEGDCTQYTDSENCTSHYQENRQCIFNNDSCVQSQSCENYNDESTCNQISNCQFNSGNCQSCILPQFSFEIILYILSLIYLQ